MKIPFNTPYFCGRESNYIAQAFQNKQFSGDGEFTKKTSAELENIFNAKRVLLTHSCTAALEMCAQSRSFTNSFKRPHVRLPLGIEGLFVLFPENFRREL